MPEFKRNLFTHEQLERIDKLVAIGHYQDLTAVISTISPDQEYEIQKVVAELAPKSIGFESKIKADTSKIKTPEDEAILQKQLEDEWNEFLAKKEEKEKIKEVKKESEAPVEAPVKKSTHKKIK